MYISFYLFIISMRSEESRKKTSESLKWHICSAETRIKIGIANRWRIRSLESKNKISVANKWKKRTEEAKIKISNANKWDKNPNWNWWITKESMKIRSSMEWNLWRMSIFCRDCYICQKCKKQWWSLNAHHINNFSDFPELRFAIDNWVTLCNKCHNKFHNIYWKRNNTKNQLLYFIW